MSSRQAPPRTYRRVAGFLTVLALVLVNLVVPGAASAAGRGPLKKFDRALNETRASGSTTPLSVIVRTAPGQRAAVRERLKARGGLVEAELPLVEALTIRMSPAQFEAMAADQAIASVSVNAPVSAFAAPRPPSGDGTTATPQVLRETLGLTATSPTGKGIGIAILDSGIVPSKDFDGRIVAFYDFVKAGGAFAAAYDDYGHGTHVAGLVGSSGALSNAHKGVAPAARLIVMKVLDGTGAGKTSDVIKALTFATANKQLLGIDVINLSLGHPIYESAATDPLVQAVEAAVRAGIVVVASAGNFGSNPKTGQPGYAGVTSPGNAPSALTVGAFEDRGTVSRSDDTVAKFSSRGPTWYDGLVKPDILANGHRLVSNGGSRTYLYKTYTSTQVDTSHVRLSGTSMAAGVASGAVALLLEANRTANAYPSRPSLAPNAVKAIAQFTAFRMRDAGGADLDGLTQGAGALNAAGAIELARAIDTGAPVGSWWLATGVTPATTIGGEVLSWAQNIVWGTHLVRGTDAVYSNQPGWAQYVVWGVACQAIECDNIVWGTGQGEADNIVWGTACGDAECDNIVWGTATEQDNIVWGTADGEGDNIVWGTNIVWGAGLIGYSTEGDNIVWGTATEQENIVWGTIEGDNIVWGTLELDNIVWGTTMVWGTIILD